MPLDWSNIEDLPSNIIPEIIIGADVVYDPIIIDPLCKVIQNFKEKNKNVEVYIASVIRNKETFKLFLSSLGKII